MEETNKNKSTIRGWLEKNNKKLLIILNIINVLLVINIGILLAVSGNIIVPEENQYLELRAVEVREVAGKNKQVIMELWGNNIELKGFDVYFSYDHTKLQPSIIQTNEATDNEEEYFEFTDEFKDLLELYTIPTGQKGEIRGVVTFDPPVEEREHIIEKEGIGKVINTQGGVLLGRMSFELKTNKFDISWFKLLEDKSGSLKTGIKTNSDGIRYYQSETTFRFTDIKVDPDKVNSISIGKTPKTEYKYDELLDVEEGTIIITKNNGEKEEIKLTEDMIEGYNPEKLGEQTITVTYEGKTTTYKVEVKDYVKDIEIQKPKKLIYEIGEEQDLTGGTVTKIMASGAKKEPIDMAEEEVKIEGFDTSKKGAKLITVTYEGITRGFGITVIEEVEGIKLKGLPEKTEYKYGEKLDITGGELEVVNEDGEKETVKITEEMVTGYDPKKLGYQTLTIKYKELEVEYIVHVEDYIASIKVQEPDKTEYEYGENINLKGGTVTIVMASGKVEEAIPIRPSMISGYEKEKAGKQTIKVDYKGLKGNFSVTVVDKVKGIAMHKQPNKTQYKYGENIDITGATIRVIRSSGTITIPVTKDMISGYNSKVCGTQIITVKYEGFSTEFVVNVDKEVENPSDDDNKPNTNTVGGNTIGGNTTGGNTTGGNTTGGNTTGGNTTGVNTIGENTIGENTIGGNTTGVNTIEGNKTDTNNKVNDTDKKIIETLGVQERKENEISIGLIAGIIAGTAGIVAIILLIVVNRRNNVKIYVAEKNKYELTAKEHIKKEQPKVNIDKYVVKYDNKVKIELSKSISKKLNGKEVEITYKKQTIKQTVNYDKKAYKIYL